MVKSYGSQISSTNIFNLWPAFHWRNKTVNFIFLSLSCGGGYKKDTKNLKYRHIFEDGTFSWNRRTCVSVEALANFRLWFFHFHSNNMYALRSAYYPSRSDKYKNNVNEKKMKRYKKIYISLQDTINKMKRKKKNKKRRKQHQRSLRPSQPCSGVVWHFMIEIMINELMPKFNSDLVRFSCRWAI